MEPSLDRPLRGLRPEHFGQDSFVFYTTSSLFSRRNSSIRSKICSAHMRVPACFARARVSFLSPAPSLDIFPFFTNTIIHFATGIPQKGTRTKRSRIVGRKTRSFAQEKRGEANRQRGKNRRVLATVPAFHIYLHYILPSS